MVIIIIIKTLLSNVSNDKRVKLNMLSFTFALNNLISSHLIFYLIDIFLHYFFHHFYCSKVLYLRMFINFSPMKYSKICEGASVTSGGYHLQAKYSGEFAYNPRLFT